jgi:hypothetical protein
MKIFMKSFSILSAIALIGIASNVMAEEVNDSGRMAGTYVKRDVQPIPDQTDHILLLSDSLATNENTGGSGFLDGFSANIREIMDLSRGTGPTQGYVIFSKGPDQFVVKLSGQVSTTLVKNQPKTTIEGTWTSVNGTGALAGVEGHGTYSGESMPEDKFVVKWNGTRSQFEDAIAQSK